MDYGFVGAFSEGGTPVPTPNTEVKPFSADGTTLVTVRESRSAPTLIFSPILHKTQLMAGSRHDSVWWGIAGTPSFFNKRAGFFIDNFRKIRYIIIPTIII